MPKCCKKCKSTICLWVKDDDLDYMDVIEKVQDFRKKNNDVGFPDFCPILCQLPEGHGRLVDVKEVIRYGEREVIDADKFPHLQTIRYVVDTKYLDDVQTIVPAERSET